MSENTNKPKRASVGSTALLGMLRTFKRQLRKELKRLPKVDDEDNTYDLVAWDYEDVICELDVSILLLAKKIRKRRKRRSPNATGSSTTGAQP